MAQATLVRKKQIKAILSVEDLAELLGLSRRTLYRRLSSNTLPKELRELPPIGSARRWAGAEVATRYLRLSPDQFEIV